MKKFKRDNLIAGGSLLGIILLFGSFIFSGETAAVIMFAVLLAVACLLVAAFLTNKSSNKSKRPAWYGVTIATLCVLMVCNLANFASAALTVNVASFNSAFTVTASSNNGDNSSSTVTATADTITITANDYLSTGKDSCGDTTYSCSPDTVTVVLQNKSELASVTFDLTVGNNVTITTSDVTAGTGITLAAGGSITFQVVSGGTTASGSSSSIANTPKTGTITVANVAVESLGTSVDTVFEYRAGGTVTIDNTELTATATQTNLDDHVYALKAVASSGYVFKGWMSALDGQISTSAELSYTATAGRTDTIWPLFIKSNSAMYYVQDASPRLYYGYFDEALTAAGDNGTVVLYQSGTLYGSAGQTAFTIGQNQKFLVPFSATDTGLFGAMVENSVYESTATPTTFITLTVPDGTTITCNGSINVNGQRKVTGQGAVGTGNPAGGHGKIVLNGSNAVLKIESTGYLYCYGFIAGSGTVELNGGDLHELMQVYDWPGGTNLSGWYFKADTDELFFTSHYYVQNVETTLKATSGSDMYIEAVLTASNKQALSSAKILGTAGGEGLFLLGTGTTITRTYDPATDRVKYTSGGSGEITLGSIKVSASSFTLNSSSYTLPINNAMTIEIGSGVTVNMSQRFALMPGTELIIDEGATLNLSSHLYVFDKADKTGLFFANQLSPLYTAGRGTTNKMVVNSSARLEINGTLNISGSGNVYATTANSGTASSSTDKIIYGTGKIVHNGTLGAGSLNGGYSSTLVSLTVEDGLYNLSGVGTMQHFSTGTYYGLGSTKENYWYQHVINVAKVDEESVADMVTVTSQNQTAGTSVTHTDKSSITDIVGYVTQSGTVTFTVPNCVTSVTASNGTCTQGTVGDTTTTYTLTGVTADTTLTLTIVHSYTESVTKEPTCTDEGVKTFTCVCGDSYTEAVSNLGHAYTTNLHACDRCDFTTTCADAQAYGDEDFMVCDICDAKLIKLAAIEASADAETELRLKFYVNADLVDTTTATVVFAAAGGEETTTVALADLTADDKGRYVLTQDVASGEMLRDMTVSFANGANTVNIIDYADSSVNTSVSRNVVDYLALAIEHGNDNQIALAKAMAVYGGYAQILFKVDAGTPAYEVLGITPDLSNVTIEGSATSGGSITGIDLAHEKTATNTYLEAAIRMRLYYVLAEDSVIDNYSFTLTYPSNHEELTRTLKATQDPKNNIRYYVDIFNIPAAYLDYPYKITITSGEETYWEQISVLDYLKAILSSTTATEAQINLAKAMYLYNQAANTYFGK